MRRKCPTCTGSWITGRSSQPCLQPCKTNSSAVVYKAGHVGDEELNGDTGVTLQYSTEVSSKVTGDLGGISPFGCFCSGLGFTSFQITASTLSWALSILQIHQTNGDLEVPMPFHQGQRDLRYAPASTSRGVHSGRDLKAGRSGFLEDPGQTEMVSKTTMARYLSNSTILLSPGTWTHVTSHLHMDCNVWKIFMHCFQTS